MSSAAWLDSDGKIGFRRKIKRLARVETVWKLPRCTIKDGEHLSLRSKIKQCGGRSMRKTLAREPKRLRIH